MSVLQLANIIMHQQLAGSASSPSVLMHHFVVQTGIPLGTASIGLVVFISFFLFAALFEGNYGDKAIDEDSSY